MQGNSTQQMQNDLQRLFEALSDMMSANHLSLSDTFDIFLDLVFIKAIYTLNLEDKIDANNEWKKIISIPDPKHYILYNVMSSLIESDDTNIKFYFNSSYSTVGNIDEKILRYLLDLVNNIQLEQLSAHEKYEYIESILDQGMKNFGGRDEYLGSRTPKKLRDFMTQILDPNSEDKVADLTCGTGALLLNAYNHIGQQSEGTPSNTFYGVDISKQMLRVTIMHSYISGMKSLFVERQDVLKYFISPNNIARYDKVYSNAPFGVKVRLEEISNEFSIKTRSADILFLESTMALMAKKGMAAIIIVGNILSGSSPAHIEIRKKLIEEMHVEVIISLPIRLAFTGIPLYLIIFKNEMHQGNVLFLDLNSGLNVGENRNIVNERLEYGVSVYKSYVDAGYEINIDPENDLYWTVSKDEIRKNGYSLDLNRYRPIREIDVPQIDNLLIELKKQCVAMIDDMDMLNESINTVQKLSNADFTETTLDNICDMRSGRPLPRDEEIENGNLPWVQIRDITKSSEFAITEADETVSEEFAQRHRLTIAEKNDVLISVRGTIGTTAIAGRRVCIGPNIIAMRVKDNQVDPWFLFGWMLEDRAKFEKQARGTIPMITMSQLRNTTMQIPTLNNQEHFVKYYNSMQKVQHIKQLSESNSLQIMQMTNALFNQYFKPKE